MLFKVIYFLVIFVLCSTAIIINQYYEGYKAIGSLCILGMFFILIFKEIIIKTKK